MKFRVFSILLFLGFGLHVNAQDASITKESFVKLDLSYPGLEKVNQLYSTGKYENAATELLSYYRNRKKIRHPEFNAGDENRFKGKSIGKANQEKADLALEHKFQPHKGYGFFDYGKDINWQLWPVKDNEVRWQLHRVYWWQPMGLAYRSSSDEKYAKEWVYQFRDWVKKNPLGLSDDNDRYAWRPLEASERIQSLPGTFNLFLNSPNFTPGFLLEFLQSFHQQADYIPSRYSKLGNHLLFEAQRVLFAGSFFPEFKDALSWRKSGITVLNKEIKKQVYPDGMQFELSPVYHVAAIDIFLKAYNAAKMTSVENEFPESYSKTIENMIIATINSSFPDYNTPMFGDSWLVEKAGRIKQFQSWAKAFPQNNVIRYFATEGKEGESPAYLSHGLTTGGSYTFRNGWNDQSTVMILKASPPGEFHAQPDNGTFELWVKGRNFTPDGGVYVYSGDAEINKLREEYRQTKVHQTLTLDNKNMVITKAMLNKWETGKTLDVLTYTNPSYPELNHQRSVLFINQKYFLIIDKAIGRATGNLGVHFQLKEDSKPVFNTAINQVHTTYSDGNNLLIQSLNTDKVRLNEEQGKVSYVYRKEVPRPAFVFEKSKSDATMQRFITIIYPYEGDTSPEISISENAGNDPEKGNLNINITINGTKQKIETKLNP
ncbi:heparan-sulfate lyase [Pedobacter steynii]|uniref:Heparan-sulfate lyase n=1 Tax=Pedobacter steynii TaxID=430522 RepID=A0A1G9JNU0_9SPHI|nr:heparin-sulfate lyase HepC [Pedobacter steynii]NQX38305.1 heparinase II/III family protein [Pedobacter steynii]SDL38966.1 heparan-sulfate lyase [Pedobacter steynii]